METKSAEITLPGLTQGGRRIEWIDVVKGMAIALVVYGHVMQGVSFSGNPAGARFEAYSDAFIYSFHMPAFFFMSGLLSARSLAGNMGKYLHDKAATIAWPYLVWTVLGVLSYSLFASFYHHARGITWHSLWTCLWDPGEFWFLHTLFCVQILMLIVRWVRIEGVLVLSLGAFFLSGLSGWTALDKVLYFLPFFAVGFACWPLVGRWTKCSSWIALALAALLLAFQAGMIWLVPSLSKIETLILGFTGTCGLIFLALSSNGTLVSRIWSRMGAASLGVFLMHPYFQGLTRGLLKLCFGADGAFSIAMQVVLAVVLPVFLYEFLMKSRLRWLFTLKQDRKQNAGPT